MRFSNGIEVPDREILAAAGAIRSSRRRVHAGGRPPKMHQCQWCRIEVRGRALLAEHEHVCDQRGAWEPLGDDDIVPWP